MNIKAYLQEHQLLTDGAMGTYYGEKFQRVGRSPEFQNLRHSERIVAIHKEYLQAGAMLIRTNSFASNLATMFCGAQEQELTRQEKLTLLRKNIMAAFANAKQAIEEVESNAFIAGDIGPIPEQGVQEPEELVEEYDTIADALLEAGAEIIWFETFSDFQYICR